MLFDKYISYNKKIILSVIIAGLWVYFRTDKCYSMIPRKKILPVFFVMLWTFVNYVDPLFLPIGLGILLLYSYIPIILKRNYKNENGIFYK
jgi:hypothetical protein